MHRCRLRKGRFSLDGQPYLVTFTTRGRWPLFKEPEAAMAACAAITDARLWRHADLLAWVLMPDHWHGLIALRGEPLSRSVQRLKCNAARRVNQTRRASGHVWASAFQDHALRKDEDILQAARYIITNPIRAGLSRRVGDYPYWNCVWL
jgi:putative transposase